MFNVTIESITEDRSDKMKENLVRVKNEALIARVYNVDFINIHILFFQINVCLFVNFSALM
jgi:hypothetical protein